jgi:hypothetical protein
MALCVRASRCKLEDDIIHCAIRGPALPFRRLLAHVKVFMPQPAAVWAQSSAMDREHVRKRHHGRQAGPEMQVSSGGSTWVSDLGQTLCRFEEGRRATGLPCLLARLHDLAATCRMYLHYSENGDFPSRVS